MFVIPGHVFIAASSNGRCSSIPGSVMFLRRAFTYAGQAKLHAFSCTLPQRDVKTRDNQDSTSLLELGDGCAKVVNVIKVNQEGHQQIYVVRY